MTPDQFLLSQVLEGFYMARRADGYSPDTLRQYDWALSRWVKFMGDKLLSNITIDDARRYIVYMQTDYGNLSPASIFHAWKAVRALYKWLSAEGLSANIVSNLKRPMFRPSEISPLSNDEIEKLLKAAATIEHNETLLRPKSEKHVKYEWRSQQADRNRLIILFLLDTGMRIGELIRMNVSDINLDTGEVSIRAFRSSLKSKPRTIYMGKRVQKEMWKYLLSRDRDMKIDPLFLSATGRRLTCDAVSHILQRIAKRANVSGVHPHIFRHTFAIQYLRNNGDIFTLQKILGHASLSMVRYYLNIAQVDVETAHRRASPVDNWRL